MSTVGWIVASHSTGLSEMVITGSLWQTESVKSSSTASSNGDMSVQIRTLLTLVAEEGV